MQVAIELPDGGGTIMLPPASEGQPKHSDPVKRTRAKRALSAFVNGVGSPFLQPIGKGDYKIAVA